MDGGKRTALTNPQKLPGLGAPAVISPTPRPYFIARGESKSFSQLSRGPEAMDPARNRWYIACHTEGLTSSNSATPAVRAGSH
jgi:hypothetical protein